MKKLNVIAMMILAMGILAISCVKEKDNVLNTTADKKTATAKLIKQFKTYGFEGTYLLSGQVGHRSVDCGGKCKYINGSYMHFDCQSWGNYCNLSASISITKDNPEDITNIYYSGIGLYDYEPSTDTTFTMPSRSFYLEDENFENGYVWLNIPAQELVREKESNNFLYKNITFTESALFNNL